MPAVKGKRGFQARTISKEKETILDFEYQKLKNKRRIEFTSQVTRSINRFNHRCK